MAGWGRRFRIAIQGEDPRTGKNFIWHMFQARPGGGASSGGDGYSSIGEWHSVGGLKFGSIEVAEVRFPLYFRQHEFRPGSAGDGQHRGGLGVSLDMVLEIEKLRRAIPPAMARATALAECSAARMDSRITIVCCPKAASRAYCAPRKSASNFVPAIALKYVPLAAADGDRPPSDRQARASATPSRASSILRRSGVADNVHDRS